MKSLCTAHYCSLFVPSSFLLKNKSLKLSSLCSVLILTIHEFLCSVISSYLLLSLGLWFRASPDFSSLPSSWSLLLYAVHWCEFRHRIFLTISGIGLHLLSNGLGVWGLTARIHLSLGALFNLLVKILWAPLGDLDLSLIPYSSP